MFNLLMNWMRDNKILPQISDTERQALEAGDVWIDGQFFGGKVDFEKSSLKTTTPFPNTNKPTLMALWKNC
jgi:hypothetical protein